MKIQYLAIIFVIIMLPVSIVVSSYINAQIDTISLQTEYDNKLITATYDAIRSFQLNTINNKYSTISDSKIRDIEASISTFYNSLGTELGSSGYDAETLREFIPAIVYTMYDGYYIYGEYYNDIIGDYQYGLKPYIYYSCHYKKGNNDFVVNYTLDNVITVFGYVNGVYVTKSGTLINPERVTNISVDENGNAISLTYKANSTDSGVTIEREILTEQLITLDNNLNAVREEYEYTIYNNKKIYKDSEGYFWNENNGKQYIQDKDTLKYIELMTKNGHLYCNSAAQYYVDAYYFSDWVNRNLKDITQENAVDSDGSPIKDFAINTGTEKIFELGSNNDPEKQSSTFEENRISVIRKAIISNLSTAIANFNTSSNTYEFVMPVFEEEDWEKITSNIAVATFMQGIPIGSKYYNNYCIITNDKNKEFIAEDSIYVITEDGQVHLPTCKKLLTDNKKVVQAYNNVDFERQSVVADGTEEFYFYPHANERCYYCMGDSLEAYYDLNDIIEGQMHQYNNNKDEYEEDTTATNRLNTTNLRKIYITALARKRYELYRNIEVKDTYDGKPMILSVTPTALTATINAIGLNDIVGYAVNETNVQPTSFNPCENAKSVKVTVQGLEPNTSYYAWVKDNAGNISEVYPFTTDSIENITFTIYPDPTQWTNQFVMVTAYIKGGWSIPIQTKIDEENWSDLSSQTLTKNGTVWARVKDYPSTETFVTITNIDTTPPSIGNVTTTTNRATIEATDNESGIDGYAITTSSITPSTSEFNSSNIFIVKQNTSYYAWAKDRAGNISEVYPFTTSEVAGSDNIQIGYTPQGWTNGTVTVTASPKAGLTGYAIETSKDGITWYRTNQQTLDRNGFVYARLVDSANQNNGETYIEITNIDTTPPSINNVETTTNTATIIATDKDESGKDGSGIAGYAITESNITPGEFSSSNSFKNLNPNTTYYAWVKDNVGNISEGYQFKTESLIGANSIEFTVAPQGWTNGTVTVTASVNSLVTGYTIETSTDGITWNRTNEQTRKENGPVYARLVDNAGNPTNGNSLVYVDTIDKEVPKIISVNIDKGTNEAKIYATDNESGILGYAMTKDNKEPNDYQQQNEFDLEDETTYYAWVKDNAGNVNKSESFTTGIATEVSPFVNYHIDSDNIVQKKLDRGDNCLDIDFEPKKSKDSDQWLFVGWRTDDSAASGVLSSKLKGNSREPLELYAVFKQAVTVTYYNNTTTAAYTSENKYYNNGNVANPRFTIWQANKEGWTARGWSTSTAGDAFVNYASINNTEISSNTTVYGLYQREITLSYDGNGNDSGSVESQTKTRYYNSGSDKYVNPTFNLKQNAFTKDGYKFSQWAQGSVDGIKWNPGDPVELEENTTFYAVWNNTSDPFYIVRNYTYVCEKSLNWKRTGGTNLNSSPYLSPTNITWSFGEQYVQVNGYWDDQTKPSSATWESDEIDTKGYSTLYYKANIDTTHTNQYVYVDGKAYSASEDTIDVSGKSTITLTVYLNAWATHRLYWQPIEIKFY